jgi:hypothetical protein
MMPMTLLQELLFGTIEKLQETGLKRLDDIVSTVTFFTRDLIYGVIDLASSSQPYAIE